MKGRATSAIKKLWTSKPSGKNGGKGKRIKLMHGKEEPSCNSGKELIWSRLAVSLGWCKSVSWTKKSGRVKLILWAETKQPAKVPRDVLSHDSPLNIGLSCLGPSALLVIPPAQNTYFMRRCLENLLWCYTAQFSRLQHCAVQCIKGYC